jgi:hypothetical protein
MFGLRPLDGSGTTAYNHAENGPGRPCAGLVVTMFSCALNDEMLSPFERDRFAPFLDAQGLDAAIWDVFRCFLAGRTRTTHPRVLRVYDRDRLVGAAFVAYCRGYGKSLFRSPLLHIPTDLVGMPSYIWFRVGFGPEVAANPGFVAPESAHDDVIRAMIAHLRRNAWGVMITDRAANSYLHAGVSEFPYASDGTVDVSGMASAQDYVGAHRNSKRKIRHFVNKGGTVEVIHGPLDDSMVAAVNRCQEATVKRSVIFSPFQDAFSRAMIETCRCPSDRLVHFVARINGDVLGYHTFVRTGTGLRMLHGAFDRERHTTHHCYENLIIDSVRYAIEHKLHTVHFGPVLNETKHRMMNGTEKASFFFHSRFGLIRTCFPIAFRLSRMQSRELLAFAK